MVFQADPAHPLAQRQQEVVVIEVPGPIEAVGLPDELAVRLDLLGCSGQQLRPVSDDVQANR